MGKYVFLHNAKLLKDFGLFRFLKNVSDMQDEVGPSEKRILDLIQITFDIQRSWGTKLRYAKNFSDEISDPSWSLFNIDDDWNAESIKEGAKFLSEHLDYLPEYIIDAAYTIMGECLGFRVYNRCFYRPMSSEECKEFSKLGTYHLAFLMRMIEELGKLGIDCRAIKINPSIYLINCSVDNCFNGKSYLSELRKTFDIDMPDYNYYFSNKIYKSLLFNTIEEFLEILLNLHRNFADMPDPKTLDFSKYYYPNDSVPNFNNLPEGKLVNTVECITEFLKKLKSGEFIKAYYDIEEKKTTIEELQEKRSLPRVSLNSDVLGKFIKYLLANNYIKYNVNEGISIVEDLNAKSNIILEEFNRECMSGYCTEEDINVMIVIIMSFTFNVTNIYFNSPDNEKNKLADDLLKRVEDLEKRQDSLEDRVVSLSEDFEMLKKQLVMYLDTGKDKPSFEGVDKTRVIEVIENYKPRTLSSKVRKALLISFLTLSLMATLKGRELEITDNNEALDSNPVKVESVIPEGSNNEVSKESVVLEERIEMNILEENLGFRDYYVSIYDEERTGITEQTGRVIRYFALKDNQLINTIGTEAELQEFIKANDVTEYIWKAAVSCLDYEFLSQYVEKGLSVPLEYTTFFTDYIPTTNLNRERKQN